MAEDNSRGISDVTLKETLSDWRDCGGGLAPTQLDAKGKGIEGSIHWIEHFTMLQKIDLSENAITHMEALLKIPNIRSLDLSKNSIHHIGFELEDVEVVWPHVRSLNLSSNTISKMVSFPLAELIRLDLSGNKLKGTMEGFGGCPLLEHLNLRNNDLEALTGLGSLEALRELLCGTNKLKSLEEMGSLPALEIFDLEENQFDVLQGINQAPNVRELLLANNHIKDSNVFHQLRDLPKLRRLTVIGNEVPTDVGLRIEVLMPHPRLEDIDGEKVVPEELVQAKEVAAERKRAKELADAAAAAEAAEDQ